MHDSHRHVRTFLGNASMKRKQMVAPSRVAAPDHVALLVSRASRRTWLATVIGSFALGGLGFHPWVGQVAAGTKPKKSAGKLPSFRVRSVLELQGEVRLKNQGVALERKNGKQLVARTAPVQSTATLDYDEQYQLESDRNDTCVQYFHEAKSEIRVDSHVTKTELRETCREIVKHSAPAGMVSAAPSHPLFAAERDLVDGSITTMYLDSLLTETDVSIGDKWNVDAVQAARLLNLDAIHDGKLTVCLVDVDEEKAQLAVEGNVTGSIRNVATEMVIEGKAVLDRKGGYVSWLAMQIEETREIGEAEPGFRVTATLRVLRAPVEEMSHGRTLGDAVQDVPSWEAASILQFQSDHGFYRFLADRRWTTYRDNGEEATLRFIVGNRRVAQCNIANLIDFEPGRQLSMAGFESDVRRLISKGGHEVLDTSERLSGTDHRLLRITVGGSIEGVPIRWIYYHISNDTGRRLTMTFTLDESSLETFAEQDQQLAGTLELLAWPSKLDPKTLEQEAASATESATKPSPTTNR
jgi:hypothetical protein